MASNDENKSKHLPLELVDACIGSQLHILTKSNTELKGTLRGYDDFVNMVLDDVTEIQLSSEDGVTRTETKRDSILLNGNNIAIVSCVLNVSNCVSMRSHHATSRPEPGVAAARIVL